MLGMMKVAGPWGVARLAGLAVATASILWVVSVAAAPPSEKERVEQLSERWRVWLEEEVYPLISKEQREAFLELESDPQRQAFEERLWVLWGRQTGYGSSFRRLYNDRLAMCRAEFESTTEDRARVLLLHGPPDGRLVPRCPDVFDGLELWTWAYLEGLGEGVVVAFYQPGGMGRHRLWNPFQGRRVLYTYTAWEERQTARSSLDLPEFHCFAGDEVLRLLSAAEYWLKDPRTQQLMYELPSRGREGEESASARFVEFSALLDDDAEPLEFSVAETPRGARGGKVKMGFTVKVPSEGLGRSAVGDVKVVQLDVVGEVSTEEQMVDRFRYLFTVPAARDELSLLLERFLRPGEYELRLKVEDAHSRKAAVQEVRFEAVAPVGAALPPAPRDGGLPAAQPEVAGPMPTLLLLGPQGDAVSGLQRFEALARSDVARVSFLLDEREVLTKNRPPFDVDLDLGPLPRLTTVTAVAYDAEDREVARRELTLNVGRERFYVRLRPLEPGDEEHRALATVEVNAPSEPPLERVEVYWNERLLATLFEPPFEAWVTLDARDTLGYLRAVAVLADGHLAEDIQFVNAPRFGSVVDVTAVELPVTVLDRGGRPIEDVRQEEFTVLEDGVPQVLSQVTLHRDLPVRLGIVCDTSGSMERSLPAVQRVVMGFLRDLLRPRDRAFIVSFSDQVDLLAGFTADFEVLEHALLAMYADRSTAFYDAVITGLFQFSGVRGRKAMVVLTDGDDNASRHSYDEALAYARRAGVTIFCIAIDLPSSKVMIRHHVKQLAEETGGRAFFIQRQAGLEDVYETINQELRTQYLLAYTSSSERPPEELRAVEVRVDRRGARVRTVAGYYPVGF